ncbi:MAG TPA: FAD-dependent thymidylate synthase, partial [Terriglobales bacterium]|nr:FAD-dependent thymidylate synthase [Terriglobales bacterium]
AELMHNAAIEQVAAVELLDDAEPFDVELASTLLYQHCAYPYRQIRARVQEIGPAQRQEIIDAGLRHRGKHDELPRAFAAGQKFRFDICMDLGGFRDMHRHRRCVQIVQPFAAGRLGYETPAEITEAGMQSRFDSVMQRVGETQCKLSANPAAAAHSHYLSPLAHRQRALFKMDFSEAVYISELRTTPAGHYSYRRVAWEMYRAVAERYPALAGYFRVHDIHEPVDLLTR